MEGILLLPQWVRKSESGGADGPGSFSPNPALVPPTGAGLGQLLQVVHQTVQPPLARHFGPTTQREPIQPFLRPQVPKPRLDDRRDNRHRLKAFLLRHGYKYSGKSSWTEPHLRYLRCIGRNLLALVEDTGHTVGDDQPMAGQARTRFHQAEAKRRRRPRQTLWVAFRYPPKSAQG